VTWFYLRSFTEKDAYFVFLKFTIRRITPVRGVGAKLTCTFSFIVKLHGYISVNITQKIDTSEIVHLPAPRTNQVTL